MKKVAIVPLMLAALALVSCVVTESTKPNYSRPVQFRAAIDNDESTRATATEWEVGDEIGIYMLSGDNSLRSNAQGENVKHVHEGSGVFVADNAGAEGEGLFYPKDGGKVDFIAYYPYSDAITGGIYPISVADQTRPTKIDFMYSDNAEDYSSGVPFLQFHHELVRLVIAVTAAEGETLTGIAATIQGMMTQGKFDLATGTLTVGEESDGEIELRVVESNEEEAIIEAILLPQSGLDFTIRFGFADGTTATLAMEGVNYAGGYAYTYNIKVNKQAEAVVIENSEIVDWKNGGENDYQIEKGGKDEEGGGDGPGEVYYEENFGTSSAYPTQIELADFEGWSSPLAGSVSYAATGTVRIRSKSLETRDNLLLQFASSSAGEVAITGLPEGYSDITLNCTAFTWSGTTTNVLQFQAGGVDVTPDDMPTLLTETTQQVTVALPDGTTTIRIRADLSATSTSICIDDIQLKGRK